MMPEEQLHESYGPEVNRQWLFTPKIGWRAPTELFGLRSQTRFRAAAV